MARDGSKVTEPTGGRRVQGPPGDCRSGARLAQAGVGLQTLGMSEASPGPPGDPSAPGVPDRAGTRRDRLRAVVAAGLRALVRPEGLPPEAAAELEAVFVDVGREALAPGPAHLHRVRAQVRAAPPRLLDWMSGQVLDHPAVLYDVEGVELLAARQAKSIGAAMSGLQLSLVAAAAAWDGPRHGPLSASSAPTWPGWCG